ncbi:hypothetical protein [Nocardia sp. NPDC020380]|uniref:DUF7691 family protein n=1 Tax=Nocardia sp. NPDC020380 TaxID=3364309 RepID=UPI00378B7C6B
MSYALSIYLVDLDRVRNAIGSRDHDLPQMIGGRFRDEFAHADEVFADRIADGWPTRLEAVRAVVAGGPLHPEFAAQYAHAYQAICAFHGRPQDNSSFSPCRAGWLETVDDGLLELGISGITLSDFGYPGLPAGLPTPEFAWGYSEWSAEECAKLLAQWEQTTPQRRSALQRDVLEAITSCMGWARAARDVPGRGLAGFLA